MHVKVHTHTQENTASSWQGSIQTLQISALMWLLLVGWRGRRGEKKDLEGWMKRKR